MTLPHDSIWYDKFQCVRIHSGIAELAEVEVFWVRVKRHYFPVDGVEDELIEKRVVGLHEAVDVLVRYGDVHLQVLTDLSDHLYKTTQVGINREYMINIALYWWNDDADVSLCWYNTVRMSGLLAILSSLHAFPSPMP